MPKTAAKTKTAKAAKPPPKTAKTRPAGASPAAVRRALRRAEAVCARDGLRLTSIRRSVLELVWRARRPAKAYDLLKKLDAGFAAPPTVYRALDFLQKHGFVHKLNAQNAYVGCAHPARKPPHWCILIQCAACGVVGECCDDKTAAAVQRLVRRNGFLPAGAALEIEGQCADCSPAPRRRV